MGTIKYSAIETSNGNLEFTEKNLVHKKDFDNMEYLKIFNTNGHFKVYINNSKDYIYLISGQELELQDFQINSLKIVAEQECGIRYLQYYLCK